jgi:hypothetical protein
VLLAFALAAGLEGLRERSVVWGRRAIAVVAACTLGFAVMQHFDPQNRRARLERWEWDGAIIGDVLRRAFPEKPLLAADAAGTLPYFSELPALDMLGLTDRHLATHRPTDFGAGDLGHELGDGRYVLEREPDLVIFCGPGGDPGRVEEDGTIRATPCFRSGHEMVEDPRFHERYTAVTVQGAGPRRTGPFGAAERHVVRSRVWMRREGGRIGIRREGDRVVVPAYLMMRIGNPVARLDDAGRFVVTVGGQAAAGVAAVPLAPGRWKLQLEAAGEPLRTMVRMSDSEAMLGGGYNGADFVIAGAPDSLWPVDVLTVPSGPTGETDIANLVFVREGDLPGPTP